MTNTILLAVIVALLLLRLIILYLVYVQGKQIKKPSLLSIDDEFDQCIHDALVKKVQDKPTSILCQDLKSEHIEKIVEEQEEMRTFIIDKSKHKDESYYAFFERMLDDKAANMINTVDLFKKYKVTAATWENHSLPDQKARLKKLQVICQKAAVKKFGRKNDTLT